MTIGAAWIYRPLPSTFSFSESLWHCGKFTHCSIDCKTLRSPQQLYLMITYDA